MDVWKKLNYQKLVKDASNLASFYGSHIDEIVCVKKIDFGSARTLKKYSFPDFDRIRSKSFPLKKALDWIGTHPLDF